MVPEWSGIPDHLGYKGSIYIDLDTAIEYINKDGAVDWEVNGGGGPSGPDIYISGMSFNSGNYDLILNRNDGVTFTENLAILASDMHVTGGTYNVNTGIVTFTNNSGGTFNVTGFTSGMTDSYTTGATLNGSVIDFGNNILGPNLYSVDLTPILSGKTNLSLFNSHTGNTSNPHQTSFNNLISTAHTHTTIEIVGLDTLLNTKFDKSGGTVSGTVTANSFIKSGGTSSQFLKADGSVDTNPAQIRISASTSISTLTTDVSGFGQNGRHVIIDNTTGITFTTSATSETNFVASYLKHGTSSVTFSAGAGTTLSALTGTALMNGGAGSRATLSRVDNLFYLTIANV